MPLTPVKKIWLNGKLVDWADAQIHVLSHVVHYGSSVFEGGRVYATDRGPAAFRLHEHVARLHNSAKIYRMDIPYDINVIEHAICQLVDVNELSEAYFRPVAYRGYGDIGVDPRGCPIDLAIAVWNWGKYLGKEALEEGVDVCVSSWNRMAPNTFPAMAKSGANYMNSQLIKMEAIGHGYVEGIALDHSGHVSEGSGENIFLVRDGALITPSFGNSILPGITRNCVIALAEEMGLKVKEENIPREALYLADEVFFTGSAAEITPIRSIDRIQVGPGRRGPITASLQEAFFDIVTGKVSDRFGWLTYVSDVLKPGAVKAGAA
jgi:branched-chain amino acid aminotransferase